METSLSLPPIENLDTTMLKVARDLAMDIYELDDILKNNGVDRREFYRWKDHPNFLKYLKSEREAWTAASNAAERTKLKAGIVMEMFMDEAHTNLHNNKIPLRDRTELSKVIARIAGLSDRPAAHPGSANGGFRLQINIDPGIGGERRAITIAAQQERTVEHEPSEYSSYDDGYDPFTSPNTLDD